MARVRDELHQEDGLTLVELMVSIVILAIVFGGFAAALINMARISMQNERRVQETALSQSLHEELQSIPWDMAALYENELDRLPALHGADGWPEGFDELGALDLASGTFEGRELLTRESWPEDGCDASPTACGRLFFVPEAYETDVEGSGRTYDVVRLVTRSDASVSGEDRDHPVIRFTTLVRAELGSSVLTQRVDSERAATADELAAFEREGVLQFLVFPQGIGLDPEGRILSSTDDLTIAARFDHGVDASTVKVTYDVEVEDAEGNVSVQTRTLEPETIFTEDGGSAPVGFWHRGSEHHGVRPVLEDGERWGFTLTATTLESPPQELTAEVNVSVLPEDLYVSQAPTINSLQVPESGGGFEIGIGPDGVEPAAHCRDLTPTAEASTGSTVLLYYTGITSQSRPMQFDSQVTSTRDRYRLVFREGSPSQWLPFPGTDVTERFLAVAINDEGRTSPLEGLPSTNRLTMFHRSTGGGTCS